MATFCDAIINGVVYNGKVERLNVSMRFVWDATKAETNIRKHSVSFEEAATVFTDPLSLTIADPLRSYDEERFVIIGQSVQNRMLVVIHTDLGDTIRIISARLATSKERKNYESKSDELR
jgi:hypothetical protein